MWTEGWHRPCIDEDDVRAWLLGLPLPSVQAQRQVDPDEVAAWGGEVG